MAGRRLHGAERLAGAGPDQDQDAIRPAQLRRAEHPRLRRRLRAQPVHLRPAVGAGGALHERHRGSTDVDARLPLHAGIVFAGEEAECRPAAGADQHHARCTGGSADLARPVRHRRFSCRDHVRARHGDGRLRARLCLAAGPAAARQGDREARRDQLPADRHRLRGNSDRAGAGPALLVAGSAVDRGAAGAGGGVHHHCSSHRAQPQEPSARHSLAGEPADPAFHRRAADVSPGAVRADAGRLQPVPGARPEQRTDTVGLWGDPGCLDRRRADLCGADEARQGGAHPHRGADPDRHPTWTAAPPT